MKRSEIRGIAFISRHFASLHTGYLLKTTFNRTRVSRPKSWESRLRG
ncbi:hypothetical protein CbuG_0822 [Coxiella burnetii CbuG_Q212]|nr:hypothetical protein CbuG_0822 [Coxiella burnetii CbuG_Q212]